ncbi:bromodomain-containing protein 7-like [Saccostrea echinata]|uniref:bromodomain-containing protein 7-like n=1 Tax=Saccostrea echinata TaxID=191078 RepID=UPI002A7EB693|nr:bromodomain-containing protein 7-like [Saccostrea echinata]
MGFKKKHKKHKSEKRSYDEEEQPPEKEMQGSLRLKLKVSGEVYSPLHDTGSTSGEKKHKHKKKKKKKKAEKEKRRHAEESVQETPKRTRAQSEEEDVSQEEEEAEPPAKKPALEVVSAEPVREEPRPVGRPRKQEEHGVLRICLKHIHKMLQKKDVNGFFAYPVNDMIAPGYSSIILNPMDLSTMMSKIESHQYRNVLEYKKDFVLMCNNAMTYNRPETIYYREAKKLLSVGMKLMSKEKLINMKRSLPFLASMTYAELGVEEPDETTALMAAIVEEERQEKERAKEREELGRFEAIPDNLSPEEILAQARAAAKDAADMLTLREPKSRFGFLRRRNDGSTTMTLLNPDNDGILNEKERVVNLGSLVGKLTTGSGTITGFKEDKRNRLTPVMYLNYGPFSSYGPQYDSTFANMSKAESDLLLSTYADETGVQYAKSVTSFVENSGEFAIAMVDHLLDILTKGEHSKAKKQLEEIHAAEEKNNEAAGPSGTQSNSDTKPVNIDINSLKTLTDIGVDVSFLDNFEKMTSEPAQKDPVQERLDQTASLINDLSATQKERLSARLPMHLAHVPGPSEKEIQLAQKVTQELKELTKEVTPADISSVQGLRSAMGITLNPVKTEPVEETVQPDPVANQNSQDINTDHVTDNSIVPTSQIDSNSAMPVPQLDEDDMETDISEFLQFPSQ